VISILPNGCIRGELQSMLLQALRDGTWQPCSWLGMWLGAEPTDLTIVIHRLSAAHVLEMGCSCALHGTPQCTLMTRLAPLPGSVRGLSMCDGQS